MHNRRSKFPAPFASVYSLLAVVSTVHRRIHVRLCPRIVVCA